MQNSSSHEELLFFDILQKSIDKFTNMYYNHFVV